MPFCLNVLLDRGVVGGVLPFFSWRDFSFGFFLFSLIPVIPILDHLPALPVPALHLVYLFAVLSPLVLVFFIWFGGGLL